MLGQALLDFLDSPERVRMIQQAYRKLRGQLRKDSSRQAADAVLGLLDDA